MATIMAEIGLAGIKLSKQDLILGRTGYPSGLGALGCSRCSDGLKAICQCAPPLVISAVAASTVLPLQELAFAHATADR